MLQLLSFSSSVHANKKMKQKTNKSTKKSVGLKKIYNLYSNKRHEKKVHVTNCNSPRKKWKNKIR